MKKSEVPQDQTKLDKGSMNWVNYVTDENGNYTKEISNGWEPENVALEQAWEEVHEKVEAIRQRVINGELSPLAYFTEKNLMDISLLAKYAGKWEWQVKRHMKPNVFAGLSTSMLEKYAFIFKIRVEDLTHNPIFNK